MNALFTMVGLVAMAVPLLVLGHWGRSNAEALVPAHFVGLERERRARMLRRGGTTCAVVAAAFLAGAVVALF
ncbi:hypothetical protein [Pseudonocardia abyssalis]|uniref:Uncharacterized protein n=1 Tax=Pseudonocardia abyssalis TaxID=2792008 RepID=A0ABS6URC1_9PSEU|nr:hypothetical protein [Pseudonocardia abyssalis]MBW0113738.1 hypothetical protein [Pseudonocardia abyssalis]MBW0134811.1 hypothetical protein [Pseudonocardia abyssalis]